MNIGRRRIVCALLGVGLSTSFFGSRAFSDPECVDGICAEQTANLKWFEKDVTAQAVWAPFGVTHPGAKSFQQWIRKAKDGQKLPEFRNSLSLNCWEYVLYVGAKFGRLSNSQVRLLMEARQQGKNLSQLLGGHIGKVNYSVKNGKVKAVWPKSASPGDVVFMDETSHVVQVTGETDASGRMEVISFSPRPIWGDGGAMWPQRGVRPQSTTLESLIEEMIELYPDVPTDWDNIDIKVVRFE
ncbi:MAG: hypothetical protein RI953_1709 [Pseudomonadota bacterium]|jgi:hypothetical protein